MFEKEEIPDNDNLYYRIHNSYIREGELTPGVFKEKGGGMSTDWSKYSTAEQSLNRAPNPKDNGIVKFEVGSVRKTKLTVEHFPIPENQSHTDVIGIPPKGEFKISMRAKLKHICIWEIKNNII